MQIATLVDRIRKEEERIKIFVVNVGRPEFLVGYVQQAEVVALREEVGLFLGPYVQFMPHLGALRSDERKLLYIEVSENNDRSYTFGGLTTGFVTHNKQTDALVRALAEESPCHHLPSRLKNRKENYAKYLELAKKL